MCEGDVKRLLSMEVLQALGAVEMERPEGGARVAGQHFASKRLLVFLSVQGSMRCYNSASYVAFRSWETRLRAAAGKHAPHFG